MGGGRGAADIWREEAGRGPCPYHLHGPKPGAEGDERAGLSSDVGNTCIHARLQYSYDRLGGYADKHRQRVSSVRSELRCLQSTPTVIDRAFP